MTPPENPEERDGPAFEFHDNRRIDPTTGQPREAADSSEAPEGTPEDPLAALDFEPEGVSPELDEAQRLAAERLEDLQRERASFTNYRNRSIRDQEAARTRGVEDVLNALLPVLDDVDRARQAGELAGPFAAIAEKLDGALARFGVERFGVVGEEFDPTFHEALMHEESADVETATIKHVIEPGYRIGERVVRAARVAVVGPAS